MKVVGKTQLACVALAGTVFSAGPAWGVSVNLTGDNGENTLQEVLDEITVGGSSSIAVNSDQLADSAETLWTTTSDDSAAAIIVEIAGFAPELTFGIYDPTDMDIAQIFEGNDSDTNSSKEISFQRSGGEFAVKVDGGDPESGAVNFAGDRFGFYLTTPESGGQIFYSDTSENTDSVDHMVAFQGQSSNPDEIELTNGENYTWDDNAYILAWEDLLGGGDSDYNDFVTYVSDVKPVPLPAAVWLMGSALALLPGIRRRALSKRRAAGGGAALN